MGSRLTCVYMRLITKTDAAGGSAAQVLHAMVQNGKLASSFLGAPTQGCMQMGRPLFWLRGRQQSLTSPGTLLRAKFPYKVILTGKPLHRSADL